MDAMQGIESLVSPLSMQPPAPREDTPLPPEKESPVPTSEDSGKEIDTYA
jgi:hypothetical protein